MLTLLFHIDVTLRLLWLCYYYGWPIRYGMKLYPSSASVTSIQMPKQSISARILP